MVKRIEYRPSHKALEVLRLLHRMRGEGLTNTALKKMTKLSVSGIAKVLSQLELHDAIVCSEEFKQRVGRPYHITERGQRLLMHFAGLQISTTEIQKQKIEEFFKVWLQLRKLHAKALRLVNFPESDVAKILIAPIVLGRTIDKHTVSLEMQYQSIL